MVLLLLVILVAVVVWQNWGPIDTTLLFVKISMPRAAFVGIVLLMGFVIGLITPSLLRRRKKA